MAGQVSRKQGATRTDFWFDQTGMTLETGGSARTYLRDLSCLPLSVLSGTTLSNFGRDRLGSITGLTSTTQTLTGTFIYDPWGAAIGITGNATNSNLRFTGGRRDAGNGYDQFGLRSYAFSRGRFTQLDPLPASITDINRYAYANCNPANFIDPTGLASCPAVFIGSVSATGALAEATGWLGVRNDSHSSCGRSTCYSSGHCIRGFAIRDTRYILHCLSSGDEAV